MRNKVMKTIAYVLIFAALAAICTPIFAGKAEVIHIKGSDTMIIVAQAWSEAYERVNSEVVISVGGGGSGVGIGALLDGSVEVANASRLMDKHELERAESQGMKPARHIVGYDALAVFLHKANPLKSLSLAQLREIFGEQGKIKKWTDIGISVPDCSGQEIVRVGRQNNSGTYAYFRNTVLDKGQEYDFGIMDMLSSKDVVHLIEKTPCAIGYSGLAYATAKVKMLCVEKSGTGSCVVPSVTSAVDGSYSIARPLLMYTKAEPRLKVKDYIDWILSDQGQCIIQKKGYASVRSVACH
jgi:phosphate transport system substrate-binding protein